VSGRVAGDVFRMRGQEKGREFDVEEPWTEDVLPEAFVAHVLAPLHDHGLPPFFSFRNFDASGLDSPRAVTMLRVLPGAEERAGGPVRVLRQTRRGRRRGRTLTVDAATGRLLEVERIETGSVSRGGEPVRAVAEIERLEGISAERFAALRAELGLDFVPADAGAVVEEDEPGEPAPRTPSAPPWRRPPPTGASSLSSASAPT